MPKRKTVRVTPATDAPAVLAAHGVAVVVTVDAETLASWPRCMRVNCKRPIDPRFNFGGVCTPCAFTENNERLREWRRKRYEQLISQGKVAKRVNHQTIEEQETENERDMAGTAGDLATD